MTKAIGTLMCGFALSGCATLDTRAWHPTESGCFDRAIGDTLYWYHDAPLSSASFRLAVSPDTGQGPTVLVTLDSGKLINLSNPDDPPKFIGAVGNNERTCVVATALGECSAAHDVYESLRSLSIPIGYEMESPADILVFHADTYYLDYRDGQGNINQWQFYGTGHPLQKTIDESMDALRVCWKPAMDAFEPGGKGSE